MSRVPSAGRVSQAERLEQAFRDNPGISRRALAAQMRGLRATEDQIRYTKTQIVKWLGGTHGIGDMNAERIANAFNALAGRLIYEPNHFKNPDLPKTYAEAVKEVEHLRNELDRLRAS